MVINSLEPEDIDVINIESCLNKTSNISFKLSNKIKQISKFKAYFTKESDQDFQGLLYFMKVSPTSGELNSFGANPSTFFVSFTPTEYKTKNGRLIIETNEYYWLK